MIKLVNSGNIFFQVYSSISINEKMRYSSRVSNIESDNSQNVGLEDYNNIFDRIFPCFTTPSIYKDNPRVEENWKILSNFNDLMIC